MKHLVIAFILLAMFVSPSCATYYVEGTHLSELDGELNDDNYTGPLNIGFTFPFYDTSQTQFYATTNGVVSFGDGQSTFINTDLSSSNYDFPAVFPFWDDLNPYENGSILYATIAEGESGNPYGTDVLVVQWTNYRFHNTVLGVDSFQVHLVSDGNITFNYNSLIEPTRSYGQSATIGIQENGTGSYVQHSYGTEGAEVDAGIRSGYAINFGYNGGTSYTKSEAGTEDFWDILLYKAGSVAPPTKPSNPNPSVGATTSTSPTLSWSSGNATNYTIRVSVNAGLSDASSNLTTESSLSLSDLSANTTYYWHVVARNDGGESHSDLWNFITSSGPVAPGANFTADATSGTAPLSVSFTDLSTNTPTTWEWDFGDGATSTSQNSTHTYTNAGNYTVSLTATNAAGNNTSTKVDYITVTEVPVATTVNASYTSVTYNENDDMFVDSGIVVNGSSTFTSARVYIGDGYLEGEDFLRFTNTSSINGSFNPLTGILSLSGSGNTADYQEAFRNIRYENINDNPNTSDRNITFVMGDNAVYLESTGHYYESVYSEIAISWTDAKAAAEARSLSGMQGYLATILTEEESVFLESKAPDNAWIGASDAAVEGEWKWVTGPENGTLFWLGDSSGSSQNNHYSNWAGGEPNNAGDEDYAHIYGGTTKLWNDFPNSANVRYYLVEYGGMPDEPIPQLTATITVNIHSINDAPSMPGNFTSPLAGDSVERGSTVNVSWGVSTDPEDDAITYDLWYFNGTWSQIAGMLEGTSFEFTVPIDDISEARFKVYANDSMDNSPENNVTFNLMSIIPGSDFTADVTSGLVPLAVNFTYNPSHYPTGLVWDFGDGINSTEQNPTHTYSTPGTYTVSLNASNLGGYNITTKTAYVTAAYVPVANFSANVTSGAVPLSVNFADTSFNDPTGWEWDFGDGGTSDEQHPTHNYTSAGNYTVSLNVTNIGGSNTIMRTDYITVAIAPVTNFTADATSGTAPLSVSFTDLSTNTPTTWEWDFGDGATSTSQSPTHTYTSAGTYTVSLNASNVGGYNVSTEVGYITVASGSSDSSRRASVSPGQPPESVTSTYTSVKHVMGGTSVEYDLSGTGSPVLGISFDAKDNEGLVVAKVQVLSERPEGISNPPGNSYQLMSIDVGSQGTISNHNADNIRINFKVSREWIRENNIDPATIRMTRYNDGKWEELPTQSENEDDEYLYFVAQTQGFSIFSVVGDKFVLATQGANDVPPVFTEEGAEVPATAEDKKTPGFTGLMGLIFVAVACVASRRFRL
ncbi:MAG: PKD domain-containing protein [Methanolobus sp.]|uniref:PKD domain-containing protein n=1 Tax=Methanolobus sp. TaxID=1874737 RepID=UPI00273145DF|nr:PKD domain-containing protein [Methanolobus sp.]MDP2217788.1 PKD domain-containing protein [Methanolobus sp.]